MGTTVLSTQIQLQWNKIFVSQNRYSQKDGVFEACWNLYNYWGMLWNSRLGLKINPKNGGTKASSICGACKDIDSFCMAPQTCKLASLRSSSEHTIKLSKTQKQKEKKVGIRKASSTTSGMSMGWLSLLARTLFLHTNPATTSAKSVAKQTKATATSGTLCADFCLWPPARQTHRTCKHVNTNLPLHIPSLLSVQGKTGLTWHSWKWTVRHHVI